MKHHKYKEINSQLLDINAKISDLIFKIFTVLFVGVISLCISIYNVKISHENNIYKSIQSISKELEKNKERQIQIYIEPMMEVMMNTGVPISKSSFINYLTKNDHIYNKINYDYEKKITSFHQDVSKEFKIIKLISYFSIFFIIFFFLIYLYFQLKILFKFYKYKKRIIKK